MDGIHVSKYTDAQREGLLRVWEESVLATHDFLKPQDFRATRAAVQTVEFNLFDMYSLTENSRVIGFPGGAEGKVVFLERVLEKSS